MPFHTDLTTPFGLFTLAADEAGLCALLLPTERVATASPTGTTTRETHPLLIEAGRQLLAYLRGQLLEFDLPLSIHGTPFQLQVWP